MPTERKQKKPTHTNVPTDRGIPAVVMGSTYGPVLAYVDPQTPPTKKRKNRETRNFKFEILFVVLVQDLKQYFCPFSPVFVCICCL